MSICSKAKGHKGVKRTRNGAFCQETGPYYLYDASVCFREHGFQKYGLSYSRHGPRCTIQYGLHITSGERRGRGSFQEALEMIGEAGKKIGKVITNRTGAAFTDGMNRLHKYLSFHVYFRIIDSSNVII
jgi:hypothetical protein